jgi:hypothetical protein
MAEKISILFFWVVTPCAPVGRYQRFRETYCLHPQGKVEGPRVNLRLTIGESVLASNPFWTQDQILSHSSINLQSYWS